MNTKMRALVSFGAVLLAVIVTVPTSHAGPILWVDDANGEIGKVDVATGHVTLVGNAGVILHVSGSTSGGDLAFHDGTLYLASSSNDLVQVNLSPVSGTTIGPFGVANVYGLANGDNNVLYGVAGTSIYSVNPLTGAATFVVNWSGQGLGTANGEAFFLEAASVPEPGGVVLLGTGAVCLFFYGLTRQRLFRASSIA